MASDIIFFLGVILFFFVLWFASGGPTKPISFAGPYITPITDVDSVQEGYGDGSYTPTGGQSIWADIFGLQNSLAGLQRGSSDARLFGEASPKRGLVTVSGYGGVSETDPDKEYVSIYASGNEPVDITGWEIESGATHEKARIGLGAALPKAGRVNEADRIVLQPGDEAMIISGESPIGASFKENKCTGYFQSRQTFYPPLALMCPSAYDEFDRFYTRNELRDDTCYELVQSTQTCTTPKESGKLSSACLSLIDDHLTYNGCVASHRNDADFSTHFWRIYLERDEDEEMWKSSRDAVKLIDENGLTVDLLTY